ncbi:hypothetical protein ACJQWK_06663 [Exserohilum turcicum]
MSSVFVGRGSRDARGERGMEAVVVARRHGLAATPTARRAGGHQDEGCAGGGGGGGGGRRASSWQRGGCGSLDALDGGRAARGAWVKAMTRSAGWPAGFEGF